MAEIKEKLVPSGAFAITLGGLTNGSARQSTVLDLSGTLFLEVQVSGRIKLVTGSPSSDRAVYIYAFASEDGTNYPYPAGAADAAIVLTDPHAFPLIGTIPTMNSGALTYPSRVMSIAPAFGFFLPRKVGIIVQNRTGLDFDPSVPGFTYSGITETVA